MNHIQMRFPGGLAKCLTLSYDDGVVQDIRLGNLMKQYGIAGTFNINSGCYAPEDAEFAPGTVFRRMTLKACQELYLSSPLFEVSTHGLNHDILTEIPACRAVEEGIADRLNLEQQFGSFCRGHAYPHGAFSPQVEGILADCGIVYARTTRATRQFSIPANWLELHPTCHHADPQLVELTEKFLTNQPNRVPWLFYLWGHSYEFDEDNNWEVIENFFRKVGGNSEIWYATNIQVYDYTQAYKQLVYSADGNTVHNPTATDLWLWYGEKRRQGRVVPIPAGQTVKLG